MQILIAIILLFVTILLLTVIIAAFFFLLDTFLELPYVPARSDKVLTIIKLANIKSGDIAIDLGSGDGRLLFAAAKEGAHAIGYEINPFLVLLTRIKAQLLHLRGGGIAPPQRGKGHLGGGQISVKRQNLWQADLKDADVIFVYGRQKTMQKFQDFVYKNARRGTRIIVNSDLTIPFPTKKPLKSKNGLFLYKI